MRGVISLVIAVLALSLSQAQRPFVDYLGQVPGIGSYDFFTNPDSTLGMVGWYNFSGSTVISKVDTNGNLIWQKSNPNGCGARYMSGMPSENGGYYALQVRFDCWQEIFLSFLSESGEFKKSIKLANREYFTSSSNFQFYMKETDDILYIVNSGEGDNLIERINLNDSTKLDEKILTGIEDISLSMSPFETDSTWTFMHSGTDLCVLDTSGTYKSYKFLSTLDQYSIVNLLSPPKHNGKLLAYGYEIFDHTVWNMSQYRPRLFELDTANLTFEVTPLTQLDTNENHSFIIKDGECIQNTCILAGNYLNHQDSSFEYYSQVELTGEDIYVSFDTLIAEGNAAPVNLVKLNGSIYAIDFPSRLQKIIPKSVSLNTKGFISEKNNRLKIYPNPTNDEFSIHLRNRELIEEVQVYSLNGNLVREVKPGSNKMTITLDKAGVYLMKAITNNGVYNRKVIKL